MVGLQPCLVQIVAAKSHSMARQHLIARYHNGSSDMVQSALYWNIRACRFRSAGLGSLSCGSRTKERPTPMFQESGRQVHKKYGF